MFAGFLERRSLALLISEWPWSNGGVRNNNPLSCLHSIPRGSLRGCFLDHPGRISGDPNSVFGTGKTRDKVKVWCHECYQRRSRASKTPRSLGNVSPTQDVSLQMAHSLQCRWMTRKAGSLRTSTRWGPILADANINRKTYTTRPKQDTKKTSFVVASGGWPYAVMPPAKLSKACLFQISSSPRTCLSVYEIF